MADSGSGRVPLLAGRVAIVTGAAHGIGRAVARRYAREGAVVYGADLVADELTREVDALRAEGFAVHAVPTDVADGRQVAALVGRVLEEQGCIDVLANIAGIIIERPVEETSVEDWDRVLGVNLRGPFMLCREVVPAMKAACRGAIINVSSRAGVLGFATEVAYCASKFGIEGMSRALAAELGPFGISVNTITPGVLVHTSMSEITYDAEKRKLWQDPAVITPAFVHLALQTPEGVHDRYIQAWELSERLRAEGWL